MKSLAILVAGLAGLALSNVAHAQFSSDFESPAYNGSAGGTLLTGQNGWYLPAVAGTQDATVCTYAGNAFGFVQNPLGGSQFAVTRFGNANPARSQHAFDFSTADVCTATFDFAANRFGGSLPASDNLGSFSLQSSTTARFFQTLYTWDDLTTGNAVDANYVFFNAAGVQQPNTLPSPAWNALDLNTWYRSSTTWSFATNQILSVSIDDLHDAAPPTVVDVSGMGWYLAGGSAPTQPLPTDFRIFGSGAGNNVNQMGWDNIGVNVVPTPASAMVLGAAGLLGMRRRR